MRNIAIGETERIENTRNKDLKVEANMIAIT